MDKKQAREILSKLKKLYPAAESELDFKNEYQLIIAVMLSAQCTDKKVNQVTPTLFKQYPNFSKLSQARVSAIEKIIRSINYYKTKSKNLKAMAGIIVKDHKSKVPANIEALEALPGVGHKTASVVLAEKGIPALPVDTHVFRVSKRLELAFGKNVTEVEEELKQLYSDKNWHALHHSLIFHGRRVCKARNPLCSECSLNKICPSKI